MLVVMLLLGGCNTGPTQTTPPSPPPTFTYGLDPDQCVQGVIRVGFPGGDYPMTMEELQPYRCVEVLQFDNVEQINLPNLEVVTGALQVIRHGQIEPIPLVLPALVTVRDLSTNGAISNVDLGQLQSIGYLALSNSGLEDLSDFGTLESTPNVYIEGPHSDYSGLTTAQTDLFVNHGEGDLSGFENFDEIGLLIRNSDLTSLSGLDNVTVLRNVRIWESSIASLQGLEAVHVSGGIEIASVDELESLQGLSSLETVNGPVLITGLNALASVDLPGLQQIDGDLTIEGTSATDIQLPQLTSVTGDIVFRDNPALPACQVEQLITRLQAIGFIGASENSGNDTTAVCPEQ